jgi:hypothetical protein
VLSVPAGDEQAMPTTENNSLLARSDAGEGIVSPHPIAGLCLLHRSVWSTKYISGHIKRSSHIKNSISPIKPKSEGAAVQNSL